jgi:hypothetical protein
VFCHSAEWLQRRPSIVTGTVAPAPGTSVEITGLNIQTVVSLVIVVKKVKITLVQALRFCTDRKAHRGSRGIALP